MFSTYTEEEWSDIKEKGELMEKMELLYEVRHGSKKQLLLLKKKQRVFINQMFDEKLRSLEDRSRILEYK